MTPTRTTRTTTTIIHNPKCTHTTLRAFAKKRYFVCLGCGSDCQFCDVCEKVFTLKTLKKYGGICGKCDVLERSDGLERSDAEMTDHMESDFLEMMERNGHRLEDCDSKCDQPPLKRLNQQLTIELPMLPFLSFGGQFPGMNQPPMVPFEDFPSHQVPVSEMRIEKDGETKEPVETTEGIVKNILAEDPQKKLWLVEWEGEEHATWEDFNTIKDSRIFKEYIERQMVRKESLLALR